jgi:hypothetical protein
MKNVLAALALSVLPLAINAMGSYETPNAEEAARNFKYCQASDESWQRRWGQYVVSYDYAEAHKICHANRGLGNVQARDTGCYKDKSWLLAGYYCELQRAP